MGDESPEDPRSEPEDYEPPKSAVELCRRYAGGERYFHAAALKRAELWKQELNGANLSGADLRGANLSGADLAYADLTDAVLAGGNFDLADLSHARLRGADLSRARFNTANLTYADLTDADLTATNLVRANLTGACVSGADFSRTYLLETILAVLNLGTARNLESCFFSGPSIVDHLTLVSSGDLPLAFLRGCGLPDDYINYLPSFRGDAIDFYSCFISHSSQDTEFAQHLHGKLQARGVRCWFAPESLKIGDRTRPTIDAAIKASDTLLLILSENSLRSDWVEYEVEAALEREQREGGLVLFPIRVDDAVMETEVAWAAGLRRQRNIGDFRDWKNHDVFAASLEGLQRDLSQDADSTETDT